MAKRLFQKGLVPYDFSRSADAALAVGVQLAVEHGGTLMVMHAVPPLLPIHGRPVPPAGLDHRSTASASARTS